MSRLVRTKRMTALIAITLFVTLGFGKNYAKGQELISTQGETLAAGANHFVAVKKDGTVWTWGAGAAGQLGGKTTDNAAKPLQVAGIKNAAAVSAGRTHSIAVKTDGSVWLWGSFKGQTIAAPTQIPELEGTIALAEGLEHTMALQKNGTVLAWGDNTRGQLGIGTKQSLTPAEAATLPGLKNVVSIAAGDYHSVALQKDGSVWTWGGGVAGQLGNGDSADTSVPTRVAGIEKATAVAAGAFHTAVLLADGSVWSWGYNAHGELGTGKNEDSPKPLQVTGLTDVVQIAAGRYHMMALKRDGTVWTWGANTYGQLGTDAKNDAMKPVQVTRIDPAVAVAAGDYDDAALLADGTVSAWGFGAYGQLGDNTSQMRSSPVKVLVLDKNVKLAGPGLGTVIMVTIDGVLQKYEQPPVLMNEVTMVPLRGIFEALGAAVSWNNEERSVTASKSGTTIYLRIGDQTAQVNGAQTSLDQPAVILNDYTMVPVRFVSEALGANVTWINETRTVSITTK